MAFAIKFSGAVILILLLTAGAWGQSTTAPVTLIPAESSAVPPTQSGSASTPDSPGSPVFYADLSVVHLLDAGIESTSGHVSTTRAGLSLGVQVPVTSQLTLGLNEEGSENFYRFSGASGLTPEGVRPWGTVQEFSLSISGSYKVDSHWTVLAGANGASTGEEGAKFGSTLTAGGFAGFKYMFSKDLSLGLVMFGESRLETNPTILPFPVVDWALPFDPEHWRVVIGGLRTGTSENVGAGVVYSPSRALSFAAGLAGVGIGNDFRLDRNGPTPDGVGRDSSVPIIISVSFHPNQQLGVSAFAGLNTSDKLDLLNTGGGRVNRVNEDAAPLFGLNGSIRF
jgi:hypothetical protein